MRGTLLPHRGPNWKVKRGLRRRSLALGSAAGLAIAGPLAAGALTATLDSRDAQHLEIDPASKSAVPTKIAEVMLASMPDVVVPLRQLTGLDLPDLHLSDLKQIPIPETVPVPAGLPLPEDLPIASELPIPELSDLQPTDAAAPAQHISEAAVSPDQLPPEVADRIGTTVKELSRDTPFSMVALTARDLAGADARVRAKLPDGTWGPWFSTEQLDAQPAGEKTGTEPVYVGETNVVQVLVTKESGNPINTPAAPAPAPQADKPPLGYAPAAFSTPLRQQGDEALASNLAAALITPGASDADANLDAVAQPLPGGGPNVIDRAQWGADESIRCQDPHYDDFLGGATVHHTAGNNDYSKAQSAGIVRAIYAYHAQTLRWCDVGYNALVDKYGQIFEGRAGGLDKAVQGAHAGGFNENTVGVAMMGDFQSTTPSDAAIESVGRFVGWKVKQAGLDPYGTTKMWSEGTRFTPFAQGEEVDLPVIFAHRDVGNTTCPGDAAYALMDRIRDIAAGAATAAPDVLAAEASDTAQPAPAGPAKPDIDIPALVDTLVKVADDNPIARAWNAQGGANGPLGVALSGLLPASSGQQYARFANGYIYTVPGGEVVTVLGEILDKFIELGLDDGRLGLPMSNEYAVPEGMRADFERGSLVFNQMTGFVQEIVDTYQRSYEQEYNNPQAASAPLAVPAPETLAPVAETIAPAPAP
ncbi:MAG: N-acetylmuramoyl-L-alanine amidase [Aldersonia sp.]|nr:N-acetylmuramoyl-L-alanine amidase [Aldersonia sp.]